MRNLRTLFCVLILLWINSLHAQVFNPSINILSNSNGQVKFSSSNIVKNTGHFYLYNDGYFSVNDKPTHQFEANSIGYKSNVFFNKPYDPQPPTLRSKSTGATGMGILTNPSIRIANNVLIGTSWLPAKSIENYFILAFDNTSTSTEDGCIQFYYNSSELKLNVNGILDNYNGWVSNRSVSNVIGSSTFDKRIDWDFTDLDVGEQRVIYIPMVSNNRIGSNLSLGAKKNVDCITSSSSGGISSFNFNVNGSPHDPNGKSVYPECLIPDYYDAQSLEYIITFQNEGNAEAINVVIKDQLDLNFLDIGTFEILDSEYSNYNYTINSGLLTITYPNINLPGLNQQNPHTYTYDQTESYIKFRICTVPNIPSLVCIDNSAEILFDNQPPIYTNVASSCVDDECPIAVQCGVSPFIKNSEPLVPTKSFEEIMIYPNPSDGRYSIYNSSFDDIDITIFTSLGIKVLQNRYQSKSTNEIDLSHLSNGLYHVQIYSDGEISTRSIVKY